MTITVQVDPSKIEMAADLIKNALEYAVPGGMQTIYLKEAQAVLVEMLGYGPPEESADEPEQ